MSLTKPNSETLKQLFLFLNKEFLIVNIRFDNLFYVKLNIIIVLVYLPKFTVEFLQLLVWLYILFSVIFKEDIKKL